MPNAVLTSSSWLYSSGVGLSDRRLGRGSATTEEQQGSQARSHESHGPMAVRRVSMRALLTLTALVLVGTTACDPFIAKVPELSGVDDQQATCKVAKDR